MRRVLAVFVTPVRNGHIPVSLNLPPVKCRRRPQRTPCLDVIDTTFDDRIAWARSRCDDNGVIVGWQGTLWNLLHLPPLQ